MSMPGALAALTITVQDDLTASDSNSQDVVTAISASDSITVSDSVTTTLPDALAIDLDDNLTVADSATVSPTVLYLLDVELTDALVSSVALADAGVSGISLSDSEVNSVTLSDVSRV